MLGSEAPIRKELHARHRDVPRRSRRRCRVAHAVTRRRLRRLAGGGRRPGAAAPAARCAEPAAAADAADRAAGNYSLKDISRTAAREAERELIFQMLQQTRWNRKETAEILGISYKALLYKIKENGLDKAS